LDKPLIIIIDDDELFSDALATMLKENSYAVETYPTAEDFLARQPYAGIGCILLDLGLPGMHGSFLLETLRRRPLTTPILIITGEGGIPDSVKSIRNGALDFLTKPLRKEDLLRAIGTAIAASHRVQPFCSKLLTLTPREWQVLEAMLWGLLNKQISARLEISEKTTKIHRSRILEKLGVPNLPELLRKWVEIGLPLDSLPGVVPHGPTSGPTQCPPTSTENNVN
jgi:FixJ family two-component response regulator